MQGKLFAFSSLLNVVDSMSSCSRATCDGTFWQRMRLVGPNVGYMSSALLPPHPLPLTDQSAFCQISTYAASDLTDRLGHYKPFQYPYEEGNNWPFEEFSLVWKKFRPDTPMPEDAPMTVTYNGQMVVSLGTIRKTDRKVWKEMYDILVSDVHDPRHVPGFAWPAKKEGSVPWLRDGVVSDECYHCS
jgi:hypothetical protein